MNNKFRQGKVLGAIAHVNVPGVASHRTLYLYSGKPTKQFEPGSLLDANAILDLVHGGAGIEKVLSGDSEDSVKTIRLGKFDIDPMLITAGLVFLNGSLYPRSFNQVFYIRNRDGEDVTEDVVNLPNGMYVFNTERVRFQSRPAGNVTVEDAIQFFKDMGVYDQAVYELQTEHPDWTLDDIHNYMYEQYVLYYSGGSDSSDGVNSSSFVRMYNAYAAMSRNYIIYVDRDDTCSIYNNYKELNPSGVAVFELTYGVPDEELTWSVPTTAIGGDMTFVEFRKDGRALGSTWLHGTSGLGGM